MDSRIEIPKEVINALRILSEEYDFSPGTNYRRRPPKREVEARIMSFGLLEAATITSLILAAWPLMFPRDQRQKCQYESRMSRARCKSRIVATNYDRSSKELVFICESGHETVQRTPRLTR